MNLHCMGWERVVVKYCVRLKQPMMRGLLFFSHDWKCKWECVFNMFMIPSAFHSFWNLMGGSLSNRKKARSIRVLNCSWTFLTCTWFLVKLSFKELFITFRYSRGISPLSDNQYWYTKTYIENHLALRILTYA